MPTENDTFSIQEGKLIVYLHHMDNCWREYLSFRKTKYQVLLFIGTVFMAAILGSGILVYRSLEPLTDSAKIIIDRLFDVQYVILSLLFFLLYVYYTYNNIQEKLYLHETQCCQTKFKVVFKDFVEFENKIPLPGTRSRFSAGRAGGM